MTSRLFSRILFSLIVVLLASACAPAVTGSSVQNAVKWDPTEPTTLNPEGFTYVYVDLPASMFNYSAEDIDAAWEQTVNHSNMVGSSQNTNIANKFDLTAVAAPDGWIVQLQRAYLVREITDRTYSGTYYNEFFRFTFAILPTQDRSGFLLLTVQGPKGNQAIPMMVGSVTAEAN